ncbi:hypothetical protein FB567DRAFT_582153 [Paraphoma chrysanthemicola]|uniref:Uncharacterized protein n=1 Tax=Paraphoma chrysanthemicola TaxID=798071 RepID=A0A8K0R0S5_9PLEO|nr:hypothetical protein FB567DRAFT_582153 [Paraphoma chrysanthemicola]
MAFSLLRSHLVRDLPKRSRHRRMISSTQVWAASCMMHVAAFQTAGWRQQRLVEGNERLFTDSSNVCDAIVHCTR